MDKPSPKGSAGGKARKASLTVEQRQEIAKRAAIARWTAIAQVKSIPTPIPIQEEPQLKLQIFEDQERHRIRTVNLDGSVWFYGTDVCAALDIKNTGDAYAKLDSDEKRTVASSDTSVQASRENPALISESGLYNLVFQSRKPGAKLFRKWVTSEVLPQLRRTGIYSATGRGVPCFVRRYNSNWNRVSPGYFSVISELFIRVYGRMEHEGYQLPDKGIKGKEIRPDVSVGLLFSKFLKDTYPELVERRSYYPHLLPEGIEVQACQYPNDMLPIFIDYVDRDWIPNRAPAYLQERDPKALAYLPKLIAGSSLY